MTDLLERDSALTALAGAVDLAAQGRGSIVLVTGDQGIGKTSLLSYFADRLEGVRILWGLCDDLSTPRPLGPFRDIAADLSLPSLTSTDPPAHIPTLLLPELRRNPPTVLVIEDVHWADHATLDAVSVLGRRIADLPAVMVLSIRTGDLAADHPLHRTLDAIRRNTTLHLRLAPLSRAAVGMLAGADAERIYALTGGNPFYVTEMVSALPGELPLSVTSAVLSRCARLGAAARELVEVVSLVPSRVRTEVLDQVLSTWSQVAGEPERLALLRMDTRHVRFHHELTRTVIAADLPATRRHQLHARILQALLDTDGDPADIVHHAEGAGRRDVIAAYAPLAAQQAAAVDSHREALMHFRRSAAIADTLDPVVRAAMFEGYAGSAYQVGHITEAFTASERAAELYREQGMPVALGRCLSRQSHFLWLTGDTDPAWRVARESIAVLEPHGSTPELAGAYNQFTDLAGFAGCHADVMHFGAHALDMAEQVGSERSRWLARVTIGCARLQRDPDDDRLLHGAITGARTAEVHDVVAYGHIALATTNLFWVRPGPAIRAVHEGTEYAEGVQRDLLRDYLQTILAWLRLRQGRWEEAELPLRRMLSRRPTGDTVIGLQASIVLAELAIRRGDPDAASRLAAVTSEAERVGELQRLGPVLELQIEWALLHDEPWPLEQFRSTLDGVGAQAVRDGFGGARLGGWAALIGLEQAIEAEPMIGAPAPAPHTAMRAGNWAGAAAQFEAVGWHYDQALVLSLCTDKQSLSTAIDLARDLGSAPLTARVRRRMRALGMSVPRGPASATRTNPAGLTARQLEVLGLLAGGLTNAEIAGRLSISGRTTEHHVSAILTKLGVSSRREATRRAAEIGVGSA